jgi:hypothetical protein
MNERREHERFAPEVGKALLIGGVAIREDFERDVTMKAGVAGAIYLAHPALAQEFDDFEGPDTPAGLQQHGGVADYIPAVLLS